MIAGSFIWSVNFCFIFIQSQVFHRQSTRLRQKMWWQDKKMCLILLFVLAVIIAAIVLIALGVEGKL